MYDSRKRETERDTTRTLYFFTNYESSYIREVYMYNTSVDLCKSMHNVFRVLWTSAISKTLMLFIDCHQLFLIMCFFGGDIFALHGSWEALDR